MTGQIPPRRLPPSPRHAPDPFADVRDKRMSELSAEQQDRAYELWAREQLDWTAGRDAMEALLRVIDRLRPSADNYNWLREQHWTNDTMCVVMNPKDNLRLGSNCPSHTLLDLAIHEMREKLNHA